MIPHDIEEKILRLYFVEQWAIGTIATQCGVHHTTVRRVLHDRGVPPPARQRPSKVDAFVPFVEATLKEYPTLPASRLFRMVQERGYTGADGHFRRLVARLRPRKPAEAFQRLRTLAGEEAQVDWAHFGQVRVGKAVRPLSANGWAAFSMGTSAPCAFWAACLGGLSTTTSAPSSPREALPRGRHPDRPAGLGARDGTAAAPA